MIDLLAGQVKGKGAARRNNAQFLQILTILLRDKIRLALVGFVCYNKQTEKTGSPGFLPKPDPEGVGTCIHGRGMACGFSKTKII